MFRSRIITGLVTSVAVGLLLGTTTPANAAPAESGGAALVLDTSYAPQLLDTHFGADAEINDLVKVGAGGVFAVGRFTEVDGAPRTAIVKLLADGTVDPAFATAGAGFSPPGISSVAVQSDGKVVVGGSFQTYDGQAVGRVVRLNADGTLDPTFTFAPAANVVNAVAVQKDGKILAGVGRGPLVRVTETGEVDPTFTMTLVPQVGVIDIVVKRNGDIYVAGGWSYLNDVEWRFGLARLNADGSTDTAFDPRPAVAGGYIMDIDVAHGTVLAGGSFRPTGAEVDSGLRAFDATGAVVDGIGTADEPDDTVVAVDQRPNGKVVIGGMFANVGDQPRGRIAQLHADGTVDGNDLGAGASDLVWAVIPAHHGGIVLGGKFTSVDGTARSGLAKYARG